MDKFDKGMTAVKNIFVDKSDIAKVAVLLRNFFILQLTLTIVVQRLDLLIFPLTINKIMFKVHF